MLLVLAKMSTNAEHPNERSFMITNLSDDLGSVATTVDILASEVGSVVGAPKDAFQRSITFFRDQPKDVTWSIELADPPRSTSSSWRRKQNQKVTVQGLGGVVALSRIQPGDALKTINGKRIGSSYSAQRARELMDRKLEDEGVLSIGVGNYDGDDILVQATIIKPRPDMSYEELGMKVWLWGVLCIKSIGKDSLFKHTVLKSADHLVSINDILCDEMKPEGFAKVMTELPQEITIIVRRNKQRWTGKFG